MVTGGCMELLDSPIGALRATFSRGRLVRLEFLGRREFATGPADRRGRELARELAAYFAGESEPFKTPLDLSAATPFRQTVWRELRRVPFGKTIGYAELARRVGAPDAARAVGQAVGANPIPIVIPCHRVIRSDGSLGGFSVGLAIKEWLLRHEGCL